MKALTRFDAEKTSKLQAMRMAGCLGLSLLGSLVFYLGLFQDRPSPLSNLGFYITLFYFVIWAFSALTISNLAIQFFVAKKSGKTVSTSELNEMKNYAAQNKMIRLFLVNIQKEEHRLPVFEEYKRVEEYAKHYNLLSDSERSKKDIWDSIVKE